MIGLWVRLCVAVQVYGPLRSPATISKGLAVVATQTADSPASTPSSASDGPGLDVFLAGTTFHDMIFTGCHRCRSQAPRYVARVWDPLPEASP